MLTFNYGRGALMWKQWGAREDYTGCRKSDQLVRVQNLVRPVSKIWFAQCSKIWFAQCPKIWFFKCSSLTNVDAKFSFKYFVMCNIVNAHRYKLSSTHPSHPKGWRRDTMMIKSWLRKRWFTLNQCFVLDLSNKVQNPLAPFFIGLLWGNDQRGYYGAPSIVSRG